MHKPTTLTEFLAEEEKKQKDATGAFTLLMLHIESAAKIIAAHVRQAGLVDIIGKTGNTNATGDEVKKIDVFANNLLIDTLKNSGQVGYIGSEELDDIICVDKNGRYNVFFDPLDGSSNIGNANATGTIFSVYKNSGRLLQPGNKQVAAGYVLYGSSVLFVYSAGFGVNGFTFDPTIGSFLLSHKDMRVPKKGSTYLTNEAYSIYWEKSFTNKLNELKKQNYKQRWNAAAVADVHRILIDGGLFLFPANTKYPQGKIRLVYEVNPLAFLVQQAGGKAFSNGENPLEKTPSTLHDKTPIVMGSSDDVLFFTP